MKTIEPIIRYTTLVGIFIIPFIPFIVPDTMFFPFITGKGFTFRILVEILFALYVIVAVARPEYRPKRSLMTYSVFAFVAIAFVADILGENPYKSLWSNYERMEGFVLIAHLLLYYMVLSAMLSTKKLWDYFLNTLLGASAIMSVYAALQIAGKIGINQGANRIDATLGNAAYFAVYLLFHIFLALFMTFEYKREVWHKRLYVILAVCQTVLLYYTQTRGAILGFIGGALVFAVVTLWKEREHKTMRKVAAIFLGTVLVVVGAFFALRNTPIVENSSTLSRFADISPSEFKTQGRYFVWPMVWKGFIERPVLGWGQEGFNFVFNANYDPRMYAQEQWFDRAHNTFFDWLIAGGLLGLLSYVSLFVVFLVLLWSKHTDLNPSQKSLLTGLLAAYAFNNMFVFDNLISYMMFFMLLSYVHHLYTAGAHTKSLCSSKEYSNDVVTYAVTPLVLLVLVVVVYIVNVPAIRANTSLIKAMSVLQNGQFTESLNAFKRVYAQNSFGSSEATEQLLQIASSVAASPQIESGIKEQFFTLAQTELEKKIAEVPNDARYLLFAGSFYNQQAQHQNKVALYDTALGYLEKAQAASPRKQAILFEAGVAYLGKGNPVEALTQFKKAYDLEPNAPESQVIYLVGGIYNKNIAIVQEMIQKVGEEKIITDNRILNAYVGIGDLQSAITILTLRLQKDPKNLDTKLSLASAYAMAGQKQTAVVLIREIIQAEPNFKEQGEAYIKQILGS